MKIGLKKFMIDPKNVDWTVRIGANLKLAIKEKLVIFLKQRIHYFSWATSDMHGINQNVITYKLNMGPSYKPMI